MIISAESEVQKWYESVKDSSTFERWMTDLPDCLKCIPINHLAMPGMEIIVFVSAKFSSE